MYSHSSISGPNARRSQSGAGDRTDTGNIARHAPGTQALTGIVVEPHLIGDAPGEHRIPQRPLITRRDSLHRHFVPALIESQPLEKPVKSRFLSSNPQSPS